MFSNAAFLPSPVILSMLTTKPLEAQHIVEPNDTIGITPFPRFRDFSLCSQRSVQRRYLTFAVVLMENHFRP